MPSPKISVIIPVYNGEKTLRQCLDSIFNQNYKNFEVILVDNNSTDHTKEIAQTYDLKYIFEPRQSRGAARNTGEKQAQGEIILMTDSDCIVPSNWIRDMIDPIVRNEFQIVQGFEKNAKNDFWSQHQQIRAYKKFKTNSGVLTSLDTKNLAIKTELLKKVGYTNKNYNFLIDTELSIRLQKLNPKIIFLNNIKVTHQHPDSFIKLIKRYFNRGYWCAYLTHEYKVDLKNTDFKKKTEQTFWSFIKIFPGLIRTIIIKGFLYAYFDAIVGLAWRLGLISAKFLLFFKHGRNKSTLTKT